MDRSRRRFIAVAGQLGIVSVAGCSQGGGGSGNDSSGGGSGGGSGNDSSGGGTTGGDSSSGVTFDLDLKSGSTVDFESVVVKFDGFELRSPDNTARLKGTGEKFDLTSIDSADVTRSKVPPGEYKEAAIFLPVVEYKTTDGSNQGKSFAKNDPLTMDLDQFDPFKLESSTRFFAQVSVVNSTQVDGWQFSAGWGTRPITGG